VSKPMDEMRRQWRDEQVSEVDAYWERCHRRLSAVCESPIELLMGMALCTSQASGEFYSGYSSVGAALALLHVDLDHNKHLNHGVAPGVNSFVGVYPQQTIGRFRADFVVLAVDPCVEAKGQTCRIVVECDGHDFHEKTKEQAKRDKSRDRTLAAAGYHVLRFTGSEIHNDARTCADSVFDIIQNMQTVQIGEDP